MGQLKVLERSLGPRPLLSGIKIWSLMGLATLSVCPSYSCLCLSSFPLRGPERTVSALARTALQPPTHIRRAWAC